MYATSATPGRHPQPGEPGRARPASAAGAAMGAQSRKGTRDWRRPGWRSDAGDHLAGTVFQETGLQWVHVLGMDGMAVNMDVRGSTGPLLRRVENHGRHKHMHLAPHLGSTRHPIAWNTCPSCAAWKQRPPYTQAEHVAHHTVWTPHHQVKHNTRGPRGWRCHQPTAAVRPSPGRQAVPAPVLALGVPPLDSGGSPAPAGPGVPEACRQLTPARPARRPAGLNQRPPDGRTSRP